MFVFAEWGFSAALTTFTCINTWKFLKKTLNTVLEHGLMLLLEAELEEDAEVEKWVQTWISVSVAKK